MKMMKILSLIACGLMLSLSQGLAADAVNTECPVKGKKIDGTGKTSEVEVAFCCKDCKAKFDKDPVAGLIKFAASADGKCPFSGKDVDKTQTSTAIVGVCCGGCKKKVDAEPKEHCAKLK